MKKNLCLFLLSGILFLFSFCKKEAPPIPDWVEPLTLCELQPITDSLTIIETIIGDWELVFSFCGFCSPGYQAPTIEVVFRDSTGIFIKNEMDTSAMKERIEFTWRLQKNTQIPNTNSSYKLITTPSISELSITTYCETFMSFSDAQTDRLSIVYQKR